VRAWAALANHPIKVTEARHAFSTQFCVTATGALVLALLAAQYALRAMDVLWLAPLWLQIAHPPGTDALWTALVVLTARLTLESAGAAG